ncbi:hypothetical protein BH11ARM1_BH11ARM1_10370 [soil metagenome]
MVFLCAAILLGDGDSVDSAVKGLYDVISGPIGKVRDPERMRSMFVPEAQMMVAGARFSRFSVEEFIKGSFPYMEKAGFFEKEVSRKTEQFGKIAQVFSTYESRLHADDPKPFERGINSIQLVNDGKRWMIASVTWQAEDAKNPLPRG